MSVRIDKTLNLVVPIYGDDGKTPRLYVHSMPLGEDVVDSYFMILGQTFSAMFNQGLGAAAGPGHAMRLLKKLAITAKVWDDDAAGDKGVRNGLVEEIRRLSMVLTSDEKKGWDAIPLAVAYDRKLISREDQSEVENALVFFISVSATLNRFERKEMLEGAAALWGAQLTSLSSTAFAASLTTSTEIASSGERAHVVVTAASVSANATRDGKPSSVAA